MDPVIVIALVWRPFLRCPLGSLQVTQQADRKIVDALRTPGRCDHLYTRGRARRAQLPILFAVRNEAV